MSQQTLTNGQNPEGIAGYISNMCPNIRHYRFLGDGGASTITGIFVRRDGRQIGGAVSTTVPIGDTVNAPVQIATTIPADAVGFIGNISSNVRMGLYDTADTIDDLNTSQTCLNNHKASYASYPLVASGSALSVGSVAVV